MGKALVRLTVHEFVLQPAILFVLVVEALIVLLMVFGVSMEFEGDQLVSFTLLGGKDQGAMVEYHATLMKATVSDLLRYTMVFLMVLGLGAQSSDLVTNPVNGVLLTRIPTRRRYLLVRSAGIMIAVALNFFVFSSLLTTVYAALSGGRVTGEFFQMAGLMTAELAVLLALGLVVGILTETGMGTSVVLVAIHFVLAPQLGALTDRHGLIRYLEYVLPPLDALSKTTASVMGRNEPAALVEYGVAAVYVGAYLILADWIFRKKDLG